MAKTHAYTPSVGHPENQGHRLAHPASAKTNKNKEFQRQQSKAKETLLSLARVVLCD